MSNELITTAQTFSVAEVQTMAKAIADSGLFGVKSQSQAFALMLIAQAEGRHPATVAQDYDIIQNRPALKSSAALARFQLAGGKVNWIRSDSECAIAEFSHPAGGTLTVKWDIERAKAAQLLGKENWKKFPDQMLRARCAAEGPRAVFPVCLNGMYVVEEVRDMVDESGAVAKRPDPTKEVQPIHEKHCQTPSATEFVSPANTHKLLDEASKVGLPGSEALEFIGAQSPDYMTLDQGRALASEIRRRRNEASKAATQQAPAHNPATGEVDAEAELFNDEAAPQ